MKKLLLMACAVLLSGSVFALEVADIKLPDTEQVAGQALVLNGAGVRNKFFFKVYAAALYLSEKRRSVAAVLDDTKAKRIALYALRDLTGEQMLEAFNHAIEANHTATELQAMEVQLKAFSAVFRTVKEVQKGGLMTLDYLPTGVTLVSVNGAEKGRIEGAGFYRALLKVWLGEKPAQDDLKKALLGGE